MFKRKLLAKLILLMILVWGIKPTQILADPGSYLDYIGPTAGNSETQVTLSAMHLDDNDAPIVGSPLLFTLDGLGVVTGTTDISGVASVPLDLNIAPGQYDLTVSFTETISTQQPFTVTSPWSEWVQDTQADFQSDVLTGVEVITSGSVLLEQTLVGEEESGMFAVPGQGVPLETWRQTDWTGGPGQDIWIDETRYDSATGVEDVITGQLRLSAGSGGDLLFSDDFSRPGPVPFTWIVPDTSASGYINYGVFNIEEGFLRTETKPGYYGFAYTDTITISDHTVEADIRFPPRPPITPTTTTVGGGFCGRLNPANGQRYTLWIDPEPEPGDWASIYILKFKDWGIVTDTILAQNYITDGVGTDWHHIKMAFSGDQIEVYYDGASTPIITATDSTYASGHIGVDFWNLSSTSGVGPSYNNFIVRDSADQVVFSDDFGPDTIEPWVEQLGVWSVTDGLLHGSSDPTQYGYVYTDTTWSDSDYTLEGRVRIPSDAFGGGIGGRLNPVTGAHYAAWIYPDSNQLSLVKFSTWSYSETLTTTSIPAPGVDWHMLKLDLQGDRIRVYYDGELVMDHTDSVDPYLSGGISVDMWTPSGYSEPYGIQADDIIVHTPGEYGSGGTLLSSAFDGGADAQWQTIAWNATTGVSTSMRVRTRTADEATQMDSVPWSDWYVASGAPVTSDDRRWIQYQVEMSSTDTAITPALYEITTTYTISGADVWNYRRRLFIDNNVADALPAGYSVKLTLDTATLVSEDKLRPDGDDLRVVWDNSGTLVELDRVAETAFNSPDTEIWFKTQAPIPGNGRSRSYYIYYGNPHASPPPADPAEVYLLWDDFSGSELDPRWDVTDGLVNVSDGRAHLFVRTNMIDTISYTHAALETRLQLGRDDDDVWWGWGGSPSYENLIVFEEWEQWGGSDPGFEAIITRDDDDNATPLRLPIDDPPGGLTSWHTYAIDWWPDYARWLIDGTEVVSATTNVPNSGIYANFYAYDVPMDIDWVRARLRVEQDPSVSLATPWLEYTGPGSILSIAYDTQQFSAWKYFTWDATLPLSTSLDMRVRTAATQAGLSAASWIDYDQSGLLMSNDVGRWVQYEATLNTTDPFTTPALNQVTVYYTTTPATLNVEPAFETVRTGEVVTYTAMVTADAQVWDVTGETDFSIVESGHGGSWANNVYTSYSAGEWTVRGAYADLSAAASLQVIPAADLSLTKTVSPDPVRVGDMLTYTVTVTNDGPATAASLVLTDTLPESMTLISSTTSQGGGCGVTRPIVCDLGQLTNGASATVTFVVTPTAIGAFTNTAEVGGVDPFDNALIPASDVVAVTVNDLSPAIVATKTGAPLSVPAPGGVVTFTVGVENVTVGTTVTLESLVDDVYGSLDGRGACILPQTLLPGDTYACVFSATVSGDPGDAVTDIVTAAGVGSSGALISEDSNSVTVTIYEANEPPVANDDAASTLEDTFVIIDVLENDTDENDDPLFVAAVGQPAHGVVTNLGSEVLYTPDSNFNGEDHFTYTASDGWLTDTAQVTVTVTPVNDAPVANNDAATTDEDTSVVIDVLANDEDVDGDVLHIASVSQPAHGTVISSSDLLTYTPDANIYGQDTFSYVVDDGAATDIALVVVTVLPINDAPQAVPDVYSLDEGATLTVTADAGVLANDSDVEGDPLTATLISDVAHGALDLRPDGSFTYTHDGGETTRDHFTYQATDGMDDSAVTTVTLNITPVNDAPIARPDAYSVDEGQTLVVTAEVGVLHNDSDVDGDVLTAVLVDDVTRGALSLRADGSFNYTHDGSETLADHFTYRASDGAVMSNLVTVTLTIGPVNDPPTVVRDRYRVAEGDTLAIDAATGVLANDSDPEGDPITATLVSGVTHGALDLQPDGSFTYIHDGGESSVDTFHYQATDGMADSRVATVTLVITPVNDAPTARPNAYSLNEGATLVVSATRGVLANDDDVDSEVLMAVLASDVTHGNLTLNPDGSFTYMHDGSETTGDHFTYRASDGTAMSNLVTVTLTIAPVNEAPVVGDIPDQSIRADDSFAAIPLDEYVSDVDNADDEMIWRAGGNVELSVTIADRVATITPPDADWTGQETVVFTATDPGGLAASDAATFTVRVGNRAPVAVADAYQTAEDVPLVVAAPGVLGNDEDADDDTLTAILEQAPAHGTVQLSADGGFVYMPSRDFAGSDVFSYRADDGTLTSGVAEVTIEVTPINDPPTISEIADQSVQEGTATPPLPFVIGDVDTPLADLTLSAASSDATLAPPEAFRFGGSGAARTVSIVPTPGLTGTTRITITVDDGAAQASTSFMLEVTEFAPTEVATIYLPLVGKRIIQAPDLVVESIIATPDQIQVVIKNRGAVAVTDNFWVDAYVDPDPIPQKPNDVWPFLCDEGIAWGISEPIAPGDSLTLLVGDEYYSEVDSNFTGGLMEGTPIYAQVDSANVATEYGAVLEGHEILGTTYNNILGPVLVSSRDSREQRGPSNVIVGAAINGADLPVRPRPR